MTDGPELRRPEGEDERDERDDRASTEEEHDRTSRDGGDADAAGTVEQREAVARGEDVTDA